MPPLNEPFENQHIMWRPQNLSLQSLPGHFSRLTLALLLLLALPAGRAEPECTRCGPKSCKPGTTCCNRGCGICVAPGGACISLFCEWGRPNPIDAEDHPSTDIYDHLTTGVVLGNYRLRSSSGDEATPTPTSSATATFESMNWAAGSTTLGATSSDWASTWERATSAWARPRVPASSPACCAPTTTGTPTSRRGKTAVVMVRRAHAETG